MNQIRKAIERIRVVALAPMPVQYLAPFYSRLAREPTLDLTVLFSSKRGAEGGGRFANFDLAVDWDVDLLDGYKHKFLWNPVRADPDRRITVAAPQIVAELRRDRYDVFVNFGWEYPANWLGTLAAKRARLPMLLYTDTDVRDPGASRLMRTRRVMVRLFCRQAAGALYTGTYNRDFYIRQGMHPQQLWFSPWAADVERFAGGRREDTRSSLALRDDRVYLLFVGSFTPRKNVGALLSAVATLQSDGQPVGVLLVGSGPLEGCLRQQASRLGLRDVSWLGFVNQRALPGIYAAADIFVLPSWRDARATVTNEAMAAGLPVVISSGTGVWGPGDLVSHGEEGFVVDPADPSDIAAACRRLVSKELRHRMGDAARRRVKLWSYDTAVRGWAQAAQAVVTGPDLVRTVGGPRSRD